ncbi:MAG: winged helix-turn-helix transcriptional regulator [Minicystis sp.]
MASRRFDRRGPFGGGASRLERDGVVSRTVHPEVPPRVEYRLTEHGRALQPALRALRDWMRSGEPWRRERPSSSFPSQARCFRVRWESPNAAWRCANTSKRLGCNPHYEVTTHVEA